MCVWCLSGRAGYTKLCVGFRGGGREAGACAAWGHTPAVSARWTARTPSAAEGRPWQGHRRRGTAALFRMYHTCVLSLPGAPWHTHIRFLFLVLFNTHAGTTASCTVAATWVACVSPATRPPPTTPTTSCQTTSHCSPQSPCPRRSHSSSRRRGSAGAGGGAAGAGAGAGGGGGCIRQRQQW